jgi:hypothetical protein
MAEPRANIALLKKQLKGSDQFDFFGHEAEESRWRQQIPVSLF